MIQLILFYLLSTVLFPSLGRGGSVESLLYRSTESWEGSKAKMLKNLSRDCRFMGRGIPSEKAYLKESYLSVEEKLPGFDLRVFRVLQTYPKELVFRLLEEEGTRICPTGVKIALLQLRYYHRVPAKRLYERLGLLDRVPTPAGSYFRYIMKMLASNCEARDLADFKFLYCHFLRKNPKSAAYHKQVLKEFYQTCKKLDLEALSCH